MLYTISILGCGLLGALFFLSSLYSSVLIAGEAFGGASWDLLESAGGCLIRLFIGYSLLEIGYLLIKNRNKLTRAERNQFLISVFSPIASAMAIIILTVILFIFCPIYFALPVVLLVCNLFLLKERRAQSNEAKATNTALLILLNSIGLLILLACLVL